MICKTVHFNYKKKNLKDLVIYIASPSQSKDERCLFWEGLNVAYPDDYNLILFEMEAQHSYRDSVKMQNLKKFGHYIISWAPGEVPSLKESRQIVREWVEMMGFENNPVFYGIHVDKDHYHIHIVASYFNSKEKKNQNNSFDATRGIISAAYLSSKYGWGGFRNQVYSAHGSMILKKWIPSKRHNIPWLRISSASRRAPGVDIYGYGKYKKNNFYYYFKNSTVCFADSGDQITMISPDNQVIFDVLENIFFDNSEFKIKASSCFLEKDFFYVFDSLKKKIQNVFNVKMIDVYRRSSICGKDIFILKDGIDLDLFQQQSYSGDHLFKLYSDEYSYVVFSGVEGGVGRDEIINRLYKSSILPHAIIGENVVFVFSKKQFLPITTVCFAKEVSGRTGGVPFSINIIKGSDFLGKHSIIHDFTQDIYSVFHSIVLDFVNKNKKSNIYWQLRDEVIKSFEIWPLNERVLDKMISFLLREQGYSFDEIYTIIKENSCVTHDSQLELSVYLDKVSRWRTDMPENILSPSIGVDPSWKFDFV
jgi:hypothetical protein